MRAVFTWWNEAGAGRAAAIVLRPAAAATLCACAMLLPLGPASPRGHASAQPPPTASRQPAPSQSAATPSRQPTASQPPPPPSQPPTYRVYVANESSDLVSRVAFTPGEGAVVEKEIPVGIMPGDNDGAHGISVSPDGRYWYVTIAHGTPRGYLWKFHAGPDTLVARTRLGLFPATMGLTPDGQFLMAVNFNLHGDMVPSDVSVVYTPDMVEVTRIRTCLMPHGSRVRADGTKQYSACMHSERLVEIDVGSFEVTGRFDVSPGAEGPVEGGHGGGHGGANAAASDRVCSPTWVEPATGDGADRFVYVACNRNREVIEVDTERWEVSRRFATGQAPYNLEATADGMLLIATLKGEQAVAVFDLATGGELARIATSTPVTHGVVASPDGRYAFVSNESVGSVRGTLDVIDLAALEVVESIELQHQSGGIDFWPATGADVGQASRGADIGQISPGADVEQASPGTR